MLRSLYTLLNYYTSLGISSFQYTRRRRKKVTKSAIDGLTNRRSWQQKTVADAFNSWH